MMQRLSIKLMFWQTALLLESQKSDIEDFDVLGFWWEIVCLRTRTSNNTLARTCP